MGIITPLLQRKSSEKERTMADQKAKGRNGVVLVRLTPEQKIDLGAAAGFMGLSLSSLQRARTLRRKEKLSGKVERPNKVCRGQVR